MVKTFHVARQDDGNETVTFAVNLPEGKSVDEEYILVLHGALEALGWNGIYDGPGMDDSDIDEEG